MLQLQKLPGFPQPHLIERLVLETGLAWIPQNATLLSNASNLLLILTLLGQNRVILSSRHPRLQDYY